ncbi:MAG: hypothetical protein M1837_001533 [Sclerophora amabilis]|nr:MAG: hypothetical protein M1837_001533 [Sclerophora amabilis]
MALQSPPSRRVDYRVYPEEMEMEPVRLEAYLSKQAAPSFWRTSIFGPPGNDQNGDVPQCDQQRWARGWSIRPLVWKIQKFWGTYVEFYVPLNESRDHLALERTFLSYLRTSLALAMVAVFVVQLLVLQHSPHPNPNFGFHVIGKPIAYALIVSAMALNVVGTHRFWRQQGAVLRGKILTGGWEVLLVGLAFVLGTFVVFGLLVAIDIHKELGNA